MRKPLIIAVKKSRLIFSTLLIVVLIGSIILIENTATKNVTVSPSIGYSVVLDAGHGGIDPGSVGRTTKCKESDINLKITKKLASYLEASGIDVIFTRQSEGGLYGIYTKDYKKRDMLARKEIIADSKADMLVSIHMNSFIQGSRRGAQVFYDENNESGKNLALTIQSCFSKYLPMSDKGISIGDYYILKCATLPSVLCECGYLSNSEDEKLLVTEDYQDKVAYNIYCGIIAYIGGNYATL